MATYQRPAAAIAALTTPAAAEPAPVDQAAVNAALLEELREMQAGRTRSTARSRENRSLAVTIVVLVAMFLAVAIPISVHYYRKHQASQCLTESYTAAALGESAIQFDLEHPECHGA